MTPYYNSKRKILYLNLFFIGILIYILSAQIKGKAGVSQRMGELTQFLGLCTWLFSAVQLLNFRLLSSYLKHLILLLSVWTLITIARGFFFDYTFIKALLLDTEFGVFLYLVPFVVLIPVDFLFLKRIFETTVILSICYLIYSLLLYPQLVSQSRETQNVIEYLARNLGMTAGFLLLTYKYHKSKVNLLALFVMTAAVLFSIYKGRRGLTITLSSILAFAFLLQIFASKAKILIIYLTITCGIIAALYVSSIYRMSENKLLGKITERGTEDTRSVVEWFFYDDMAEMDWVIGRGINGEYYSPNIYEGQISDYRTLIETGYLQIILKGGLVRLLFLLLMLVPAAILGLFYSNNILGKACGIWIMVALISLYPGTVESFSMQYLLVWISVGICFSKSLRQISDDEIAFYLAEAPPFKIFNYGERS